MAGWICQGLGHGGIAICCPAARVRGSRGSVVAKSMVAPLDRSGRAVAAYTAIVEFREYRRANDTLFDALQPTAVRAASITEPSIVRIEQLRRPPREASPIKDSVAAISVGMVDGAPVLDLDYNEDFAATVDMNVVMTGSGRYVEVQGTGEEATFSDEEFQQLLQLDRHGITQLTDIQRHISKLGGRSVSSLFMPPNFGGRSAG